MKYPALRAYKAAITDTNNINIPFFKSTTVKIFMNKRGQPFMSVGGFGAVFRLKDKNDNQYALKVFTRDIEGRAQRYTALHDTLKITRFPFMVDFHYVSDGLKVGNKFFPVVVMQWGSGIPLNTAIENDLEGDGKLQSAANIAGNLFLLAKTLQEWKMGHGDFQEGNLLVGNDNRITLIDYDGMYVPSLNEKKASEMGLADYQHPARDINSFGSTIDDFALISILFQLSIIDPKLWKANKGDSRLVLKEEDYKEPKKSAILQKGLKSKSKHIKSLAALLEQSLLKNPLEINAIETIQSRKEIMAWLVFTEDVELQKDFSSIIEKVVSLNNNQVQEFEDDSFRLPEDEKYNQVIRQPVQQNRSDGSEEQIGAWDYITDIFLEADDDSQLSSSNVASTKSSKSSKVLGKITNTLTNLFFEEEENSATKPAKKTSNQEKVPIQNSSTTNQAASNPGTKNKKTKNSRSIKEKNKTDAAKKKGSKKQVPVPEWMKKRKRK